MQKSTCASRRVALLLMMVGCGGVNELAGPEITISESTSTTPAGSEHIQVLVPAGPFKMGSQEGSTNERPVHQVTLDAFYIDRFEVTNALYFAYVEAMGEGLPQFGRESAYNQAAQPVVGVSWSGAEAYCIWAGMQLPTEAQWEKAAGGLDGRKYPWGNENPTVLFGNFGRGVGPAPVGSYPAGASPYGAEDMAGNVWEWTVDQYEHIFYDRSPEVNPVNLGESGLETGPDRTLRGGSWYSSADEVRVAARSSIHLLELRAEQDPEFDNSLMFARIGFRCVKNLSN
ncbi:MAG: SUMF1/EgtB/PvdO family nonheme iron enzyme [bacterium]|nr:SUMF1/EgtB/PvdO family nonheme iron enzyme [bacterium]